MCHHSDPPLWQMVLQQKISPYTKKKNIILQQKWRSINKKNITIKWLNQHYLLYLDLPTFFTKTPGYYNKNSYIFKLRKVVSNN
jgi:hypothetical protein